MKRSILLILAVFLVTVAGAQAGPVTTAPAALTIQEAVRIALEKNPAVQAADAYVQAVQQGVAAAKASRYPRLDFSEGYTRGDNPVYVFGTLLTQRRFTDANFALAFLNTPPPVDNFRTAFSAAMPLYDARVSRAVRGAKLQTESARAGKNRTEQEIVFQVVNAYLNVLLAQENVRVAQATLEMTKSDLARAKTREENGLAVPSDVLSVQVQLAQAEEELLRAKNAVELARAALNTTMGLPEDAPASIAESLDEATYDAGLLEARQTKALAARPDLLQTQAGKQQAANGTRLARAEFLPTVSLFSSWEADNRNFASHGGNNWTAGASINFNLFDGGAKIARLRESKARELQARAVESQMISAIRLQVREAYLNVGTAQKRLEVMKDASSQAAESLRVTQNRYEEGLATVTDLLRAETARASAEKNSLNAIYDYRLSYAALELATGELSVNSPAVTLQAQRRNP